MMRVRWGTRFILTLILVIMITPNLLVIEGQENEIILSKGLFDNYYEALVSMVGFLKEIADNPEEAVRLSSDYVKIVEGLPEDPQSYLKPIFMELAGQLVNLSVKISNASRAIKELPLIGKREPGAWICQYCRVYEEIEDANSTLRSIEEKLDLLEGLRIVSEEGNLTFSFTYPARLGRTHIPPVEQVLNSLILKMSESVPSVISFREVLIYSPKESVSPNENIVVCGILYPRPRDGQVILHVNYEEFIVNVTPANSFMASLSPTGEAFYNITAEASYYLGDVYSNSLFIRTVKGVPVIDVGVELENASIYPGQEVTVNGSIRDTLGNRLSGPVEVYINDSLYKRIDVEDGLFSFTITPELPGKLRISIVYLGSDSYRSKSRELILDVSRIPTKISISVDKSVAYENESLVISGNLATVDGAPVPERSISLYIDNELLYTALTSSDGSFEFRVTPPPGDHMLTASFAGDSLYEGSSSEGILIRIMELSAGMTGGNISSEVPQEGVQDTVFLVAILLIVALLTLALLLMRRRYQPARIEEEIVEEEIKEVEVPERVEEAPRPVKEVQNYYQMLVRSDELIREGNYRGAIVNEYIALLGVIGAKPSQTPKEVLESIADPVILDDLEKITKLFERVVYGDYTPTPSEVLDYFLSIRRVYLWMYLNYGKQP